MTTKEEAKLICDSLRQLPVGDPQTHVTSRLHSLTSLFQYTKSKEAFEELRDHGTPILCQIVGEQLDKQQDSSATNDVMFVLKILAMYQTEEGAKQVIGAAQQAYESDGFLWSIILQQFDQDHPHTQMVLESLVDPLPQDFIAIALLDCANSNALAGSDFDHPFDSPAGKQMLGSWLRRSDKPSYAYSAITCLPYIENPGRDELLKLGMDYSNQGVQINAAWASAALGDEAAIERLSEFCLDPLPSYQAIQFLKQLDRADAVPSKASEPQFAALAKMTE